MSVSINTAEISSSKSPSLIVKNNKLIEASYMLTLAEIRLLNIVFAEISKSSAGSQAFWFDYEFVVTADEYSKVYDVSRSNAYEALEEASKRLFNRYIKYEGDSMKGTDFVEIIESRWVSEIRYNQKGGYVTLVPTRVIMDLVGIMPPPFTKLYLENMVGLTSIYAKRIYEIMVQWRGAGCITPKISVSELRWKLGIEETQYKQMSNFKRIVLDSAIEQINRHTDILCEYEQVKQGKTIVAFIFKFKEKKKAIDSTSKPVPPTPPTHPTTNVSSLIDDDYLKFTIAKCNEYFSKKNITDEKQKENYIKKAMSEGWYENEYKVQENLAREMSKTVETLPPTKQSVLSSVDDILSDLL